MDEDKDSVTGWLTSGRTSNWTGLNPFFRYVELFSAPP